MSAETKILKSIKLFKGFKAEELNKIEALMQPMSVKEGEVLTKAGDPASTFFIILSGNFLVYFESGHAFTVHEPGDVIGWSILQASSHHYGTGVALTDGEVLTLSGGEFLRLLNSDTLLWDKLLKAVAAQRCEWFRKTRRKGMRKAANEH